MEEYRSLQRTIDSKLERLDEKMDRLNEQVTILRIENRELKIKSSFWASLYGVMGGAISAASFFIYEMLHK